MVLLQATPSSSQRGVAVWLTAVLVILVVVPRAFTSLESGDEWPGGFRITPAGQPTTDERAPMLHKNRGATYMTRGER